MATDKLSGKLPQYLIKWYFMGNGLGYGYQGCIMQCSLTVQYVSVWVGKDGILAVKNVFGIRHTLQCIIHTCTNPFILNWLQDKCHGIRVITVIYINFVHGQKGQRDGEYESFSVNSY